LDNLVEGPEACKSQLFAVDAEARRKALNFAARHIRRQETALAKIPVGAEIRAYGFAPRDFSILW
jgi:hypothetical protein